MQWLKSATVTMQCYTPSIFSRSKTPRLVIQPDAENMHPTKESLDFAARLSSKFEHANLKVEATYDYSKKEIPTLENPTLGGAPVSAQKTGGAFTSPEMGSSAFGKIKPKWSSFRG